MPGTITSANAVLTLTCPSVFGSVPQLIEGFATEDSWSVQPYEIARAVKGVDGKKSAGFVPANKEMEIALMADSASRAVFNQIIGVMKANRTIVVFDMNLVIPDISEVWEFTNGNLGPNVPGPPAGKKILDPVTFMITWDDIQPAGL